LIKFDGFHFFNALSYGKTPWVTTFETSLPRWGEKKTKKGLDLIAGDACKGIFAMSEAAKKIQLKMLKEEYPSYLSKIEKKLRVLHPSQKLLIDSISEKRKSENIVFTLIGADFFRKGGKEVLIALGYLFDEGYKNWEFNIISNLQFGDYASQATVDDLHLVEKLIKKYSDNINHYRRLPNTDVLKKLINSDVALLPTYGDTYGYSVLEAQAAGCPVVSTDLRALPEINNNDIGWVISVRKDNLGNAVLNTKEDRIKFSNHLIEKLKHIFKEVLMNPELARSKGSKALEHIKTNHSIESRRRYLEDFYNDVMTK